jgi:NAD(P)-dependent dehydrogenase (short-subunit alcohol dehydrogenase family)
MNRVEGKVALVTGGALGIGKAIAHLLAQEGAKVAITDIRDGDGKKVAHAISDHGGEAAYWHLDVSREPEVEAVFKEVQQRFGHIDLLINNAAILGANKPTDEISEEEWDLVTAINQKGVFFCTKHAIPQMRAAGRGSIINLSSIYGIVGAGDLPPYHASKGAVRLMSKTDALLYASDNIRVNSIHPGGIRTPMVDSLAAGFSEGPEAFIRQLASRHPIGRLGEPDDIAYGVLYLASDESKFVTGAELVIDGGYTAQ